jgi:hypothetical protein
MNRDRIALLLLVVGMVLSGCSGLQQTKAPGYGDPPVITASFCVDKGMYGDPIKVYLAAEDPHGDMDRIAVQVTQTGYGFYPTSWTVIKPKYEKKFVGYLQWDTFSPGVQEMPEWTRITMNVTIIDKQGFQSKAVVLPYMFVTGTSPSPALPPPFDQGPMHRLGWIDIDLINPQGGIMPGR